MTIAWRPQLDTGNTRIDNDHKKLFELINAVERALKDKHGAEALTATLDALYDYTNYHFEREEHIMQALKYPQLEGHKRAHDGLKAQLIEVRAKIVAEAQAGQGIAEAEIDALTILLRDWLVNHIIGMDLPLKPVLAPMGAGYTAEN